MQKQYITNLKDVDVYDSATTKKYVDDKFNSIKPWINGEYKWMPTTVASMPSGWVKVTITNGYTLIAGTAEGTTNGQILRHNHFLEGAEEGRAAITTKAGQWEWKQTAEISGSGTAVYPLSRNQLSEVTSIDSTGGANNLSAGRNATLWQYNPVKYAEIIAKGLTPHEYAEIEKEKTLETGETNE